MCDNCWREYYDAARIDTPLVRATAAAIAAVYEYSMSGGRLHILIDDFNLDDDNIAWNEKYLREHPADSQEQHEAEAYCLGLLRNLSVPERASALALHDGYWTIPEAPHD